MNAPAQIGAGELVVTFKLPPTFTLVVCMPVQPVPLSVTFTMYVVVAPGFAAPRRPRTSATIGGPRPKRDDDDRVHRLHRLRACDGPVGKDDLPGQVARRQPRRLGCNESSRDGARNCSA